MTKPNISDQASEDAINHLYTDSVREVGGFFIGAITDGIATIDASLPALAAKGSEVNLTFGHEVWSETMAVVDRDHPGKQIVGWFHSHPGHGVFLSGYDEFIQTNFFPSDGMVAYVLDPHDDVAGWFETRGGKIVELGTSAVTRPTGAAQMAEQQARSRDRRGRGVLVAAAIAIAGFVGGYVIAGSDDTDGGVDATQISALELRAQESQIRASEAEGKLAAFEAYLRAAEQSRAASQYVIRSGDSLWGIAEERLGSGERWREVYQNNVNLIGPLGPGGALPTSAIGVTILLPSS